MILKRMGQGILVLFVLETVTFFLIRMLPGHPFMGEKKLPEHVLAPVAGQLRTGPERPCPVRRYWWNMLAHGDLGPSLVKEGISVADMIGQSFPVSLQLGVLGMVISIMVGIPAGILGALYKNRWIDWWVMLVSMAGICIPAFVVAPLLGVGLGMHVPGLSVAGWDSPGCVLLPALTLGLVNAAYLARLTRGGMLEVLGQDLSGRPAPRGRAFPVVWKHALRGGLIPAISYLGPAFAAMITGSFVVETCFQVPGMGQHFVNATTDRDYFLIQGLVLFYGILIVAANLAVDLVQMAVNPRLRAES